ncbi:hypothetical protein EDB84DRAFT_1580209, partial [Lactarius hengduanensis]
MAMVPCRTHPDNDDDMAVMASIPPPTAVMVLELPTTLPCAPLRLTTMESRIRRASSPKWQTCFCPHPIFSRRKTPPPPADPVPVAAPVHQETYDTPHAPALPPEPEPKLWPAVPNDVIVPAPSPAPVPALAFKNISVSHLSSSPKLRHRAAMAAAHHPPE